MIRARPTLRRRLRAIAAFATLLSVYLPSHAAMQQFLLDNSNIGPLPDGTPYLQLTIWDGSNAAGMQIGSYTTTSTDVVFRVTPLASLSQFAVGKFGLDEFAFNTIMNLNQFSTGNFKLPSNWTVGIGSQNADGFGKFELIP